MVLFAPMSCTRFVKMPYLLILAITTRILVLGTSKLLSHSLNQSDCLLQLILMEIEWQLNLISNMGISTDKTRCFVGVIVKVNCKEFNLYDILTKKNTQIDRLSVLSAAKSYKLSTNKPIIACCANLINTFASNYG